MTCVSREYEIKIKIVQEQRLQLKMMFLLGHNSKNFIYWRREELTFGGEGIKIWYRKSIGREIFQSRRGCNENPDIKGGVFIE